MSAVYTLGIDVGSTASKCIILKDGKEIVAKSLIDVGAGTSGPQRAIDAVLEAAGMTRDQMAYVLATGYGRNSLMGLADKQMSELSCHARGASFLFPEAHTVIDIGGQDVKVLRIENGTMTNFQMNDKCAAGTGRFLDVMARVLEVRVEDLGDLGAQSKKHVGISSTCTVFAESEVISQLSMEAKRSEDQRHPSLRGWPCGWPCPPDRRGKGPCDDRRCSSEQRRCICAGRGAGVSDPHFSADPV